MISRRICQKEFLEKFQKGLLVTFHEELSKEFQEGIQEEHPKT